MVKKTNNTQIADEEINLTIATAMKLRKRLNEHINVLTSELNRSTMIDENLVNRMQEAYHYGSFAKTVEMYELFHKALLELNEAIDENNVEGKKLLDSIQTINSKINVYNRIKAWNAYIQPEKERNPVSGKMEVVKTFVSICTVDPDKIVSELTKQKNDLEDQLSEFNATKKFKFKMNNVVYSEIYA